VKAPVPREVFEGIEAVRQSGRTNLLDRPRVVELAEAMGFVASAVGSGEPGPLRAGRVRGSRGSRSSKRLTEGAQARHADPII
jgi:hypothetical protein